jgi:hypothetical protein
MVKQGPRKVQNDEEGLGARLKNHIQSQTLKCLLTGFDLRDGFAANLNF